MTSSASAPRPCRRRRSSGPRSRSSSSWSAAKSRFMAPRPTSRLTPSTGCASCSLPTAAPSWSSVRAPFVALDCATAMGSAVHLGGGDAMITSPGGHDGGALPSGVGYPHPRLAARSAK
eukprot:scaffold28305_cov27-Tisochrysis_lutea.AAC.2